MQKILIIVGPTTTGKSDLAVKLAKKFNAEVISADSRQVYQGLDIGTGKITKKEMLGVPHHLIDVANPKRQFTAADFVKKATKAIRDIRARRKLPIICGGTGFYISALLGETTLASAPPNISLRKKLSTKRPVELFALLKNLNPKRAAHMNQSDRHNPRRLIRAIEIAQEKSHKGLTFARSAKVKPLYYPLLIGLTVPRGELRVRIRTRLKKRLAAGMIAEARRLHKRGLSWKRMDELGLEYRYLARYLQGKISRDEMIRKLETEIWRYSKRQMTWLKRDKQIQWFKPTELPKMQNIISKFLLGC